MNYFFLYNTDGTIYGSPYFGDAEEWTNIPDGCAVLGPLDETNTDAQEAYWHPDRYLIQNGQFVQHPYITVESNQSIITATVFNFTASSVDFVIAGATFTQPLTNNQASITVNLDEVIADQTVEVRVTATGCQDGVITIGGNKNPSQYLLAKTQADGSVLVKCTSKKEIKEYGLTINVPEEDREADEGNLLDLVADGVFKLLQWAQNPTYSPLTLTADEQNAVADFIANYGFRLKLSDAKPVAGSATAQNPRYPDVLSDKSKANTAANSILSRLADPDTINP